MGKKRPPPPPPPKRANSKPAGNKSPSPGDGDVNTRQKRLGLTSRTYECVQCGDKRIHSSGYVFLVNVGDEQLHFCDVDCCDIWEESDPVIKKPAPLPDRRGAIAATKAKNEEDDLRA